MMEISKSPLIVWRQVEVKFRVEIVCEMSNKQKHLELLQGVIPIIIITNALIFKSILYLALYASADII